jgi:GNAT superfamily N-acetyltransferase
MQIRPARLEDTVTLTAIAHAAKRVWGYPEEVLAAWSPLLTITPADLAVLDVFVATDGQTLLGFGALDAALPEPSLDHLWVAPAAMRHGVGSALFAHAAAVALACGAHALRIAADPFAEPFYLRLGAVRVGALPAPILGAPQRGLPLLRFALIEPVAADPAG